MSIFKHLLTTAIIVGVSSAALPDFQSADAQIKTREERAEDKKIYQERRRQERAMESQIDKFRSSVAFEVKVDCHHGSVSNADTNDRITVNFLRGKKIVASTSKSGVDSCGAFDADDVFRVQEPRLFFDTFEITTSGDNAFFIDEFELIGPQSLGTRSFGKDGGRGWCLSTDANDANGAWRDYVSNCETTKTFVVHDWYKAKYDVR